MHHKRIRLLMIGLGRMGQRHLRALAGSSEFELVATVDSMAAGISGVPHYRNLDDVPDVFDVAIVAASSVAHFSIAQNLVNRGKHLLVEKPLTVDPVESQTLCQLATSQSVKVACGFVERFNPLVQAVHQMYEQGRIGTLLWQRWERSSSAPGNPQSFGGVALDLAVHDLDLMGWFGGAFTVEKFFGRQIDGVLMELASFYKGLESPWTATIWSGWKTSHRVRRGSLVGSEGSLDLDSIAGTAWFRSGREEQRLEPLPIDPLTEQLRHWFRYLKDEPSMICTADSASRWTSLASQLSRT